MKVKLIMMAIFSLGLVLSTNAQSTATPKVTKRQAKQQVRIQQGKRSGELTKGETARLQAQQRSINRTKKRAKADGNVTNRERAVIHKRQNNANRNIRRKKNN